MPERYNDALPEIEKKGWRLSERIKGISKGHGIDTCVSAKRFVCESVLWALKETTALDFMVTGGLLHDQRVRQTGDADIRLDLSISAPALYGDVSAAARHLRQFGISVLVGEVTALDMGGKGQGFRVSLQAKIGPTNIVTHLDVGFGPRPDGAVCREFRSLFKGPSFTAWAQPLEAQVADKFAAIVTLGVTNTRLKDFADLSRMYRTGLDDAAVARALVTTMRERKADTAMLLKECPEGLSYDFAAANKAPWREYVARHDRGLDPDFELIASDVFAWWQDIQRTMLDLAERDALEPRPRVAAPSTEPEDGNVVSLESYRRLRA